MSVTSDIHDRGSGQREYRSGPAELFLVISGVAAIICGWLWFATAHITSQCSSVLVQAANQQLCQSKVTEHATTGFLGLVALVAFVVVILTSRKRPRPPRTPEPPPPAWRPGPIK